MHIERKMINQNDKRQINTMENNEIKKLLYKQQPKAKFIRIKSNHAYYGTFVELKDKTMQQVMFDIPIRDLGDAELWRDEEAKLLIRYLTVNASPTK